MKRKVVLFKLEPLFCYMSFAPLRRGGLARANPTGHEGHVVRGAQGGEVGPTATGSDWSTLYN